MEQIGGITRVVERVHTEDRVSMSLFPSTFFSILLQEYSINFRSICVCTCKYVCMYACMLYVLCICRWRYEWAYKARISITRESLVFLFLFSSFLLYI